MTHLKQRESQISKSPQPTPDGSHQGSNTLSASVAAMALVITSLPRSISSHLPTKIWLARLPMQGLGQGGLASVARVLPLTSCLWLAVCSSPAPSHCLPPFLHSFVFPRSFERPRCVHYGKRWWHLVGGEGRQQQGIGKVVIFHPPPPHSVGEPIFPDFVAE